MASPRAADLRLLALRTLRQWIIKALVDRKKGDSALYLELLQKIDSMRRDADQLRVFSQCVSYFDERAHEELLVQILGMSLWSCSLAATEALVEFAINLASANASFLPLCLDLFVRSFLPPSSGIPSFMGVLPAGQSGGVSSIMKAKQRRAEEMARKGKVLAAVRSGVERMAEIIPMTAMRLQPLMAQRMPHKLAEKEMQCLYLESIFNLAESSAGRSLRDSALMAVVDRLIEIDVEIRWEDILRSEEGNDASHKVYLFHMDLDDASDDVSDDEGDHAAAPAGDDETRGPGREAAARHGLVAVKGRSVPSLDEMADKMDAMMDLTFEHVERRAREEGQVEEVLATLLRSFQTTILDTYKSKFTQFLLFYACSLSPESGSSSFSNLLTSTITAPSRPANSRMAAAAYWASFMARASFAPLHLVASSLETLCKWCANYVKKEEDLSNQPLSPFRGSSIASRKSHHVFCSVCQAILYVCCYRLSALSSDPPLLKLLHSLPLKAIVFNRINPLAVCLESVTSEFCRQAKRVLLFSDEDSSIALERSSRRQLMSPTSRLGFGGENELDMFFPFDPYLLKHSLRFIKPIFTRWQQPFGDEAEDEDDDEDHERDSEQEEDDDSSSSCADHDSEVDRMGMSLSDRSHGAFPSSIEGGATPPVHKLDGFSNFGSHVGVDHGFVGSYGENMSFTPPSQMPQKLPPRLTPLNF